MLAAQGAKGLDRAPLHLVQDEGCRLVVFINLAAGDPGVLARPKILSATSVVTSSTATWRNATSSASK
jgi:hypothetical protein